MTELIDTPRHVPPLNHCEFHILLALADRQRHGYGIMQEVASRSGGTVRLGPGTLYGAIKRMLAAGLIEVSATRPVAGNDDQRRRCYYRLTDFGRTVAAEEAAAAGRLGPRGGSEAAGGDPSSLRCGRRLMTGPVGSIEISARMYGVLLKAYPVSFRREYADEMMLVFREEMAREWRERGMAGVVPLWFCVFGDLAWTIPEETLVRNAKEHGDEKRRTVCLVGRFDGGGLWHYLHGHDVRRMLPADGDGKEH